MLLLFSILVRFNKCIHRMPKRTSTYSVAAHAIPAILLASIIILRLFGHLFFLYLILICWKRNSASVYVLVQEMVEDLLLTSNTLDEAISHLVICQIIMVDHFLTNIAGTNIRNHLVSLLCNPLLSVLRRLLLGRIYEMTLIVLLRILIL